MARFHAQNAGIRTSGKLTAKGGFSVCGNSAGRVFTESGANKFLFDLLQYYRFIQSDKLGCVRTAESGIA